MRRPRLEVLLAGTLIATSGIGQHAVDARPGGTVCVLDEGVLMNRLNLAAAMAARFRQVRETAQRGFDADSRTLEAEERAFPAQSEALTPAEAMQRGFDIVARRDSLRQRGEQINRDLASLDKELTRTVVQLALPTIRAVEAQMGCKMVVARSSVIDLADPAADISAKVVEMMNNPNYTR